MQYVRTSKYLHKTCRRNSCWSFGVPTGDLVDLVVSGDVVDLVRKRLLCGRPAETPFKFCTQFDATNSRSAAQPVVTFLSKYFAHRCVSAALANQINTAHAQPRGWIGMVTHFAAGCFPRSDHCLMLHWSVSSLFHFFSAFVLSMTSSNYSVWKYSRRLVCYVNTERIL